VVVLTSLADRSVAALALGLGAHACLHKSAPAADLIAAIGSVLAIDGAPAAAAPVNAGGALSLGPGINRP